MIDGTDASILVDYNDSSAINHPIAGLINETYEFNHVFQNSGYFYVNITVFNLVSSVSKIIRVSIKLNFKKL